MVKVLFYIGAVGFTVKKISGEPQEKNSCVRDYKEAESVSRYHFLC